MPRLLLAVLVGALATAGWWWWPTDERRVRAHIDRMADAVNGRDGESDLERMARVAILASGLSPDVIVEAADRRIDGRDAVLAAARALVASRRESSVALEDVSVSLSADRSRADARVTARMADDYQELHVSLVQRDGAWLVDGVEAERPLRRPGVGADR